MEDSNLDKESQKDLGFPKMQTVPERKKLGSVSYIKAGLEILHDRDLKPGNIVVLNQHYSKLSCEDDMLLQYVTIYSEYPIDCISLLIRRPTKSS